MNKNKNITSYFDQKAKKYYDKSVSFPWSIIRNIEANVVKKFIGNIKNRIVFDVGCGSGYYSKLLIEFKAKKVFALDGSVEMLNNLNDKNIIKINQDAEKIKIKKKFDKIICTGLLEFVKSPEKVLKNIKKSAKKNCDFVILCPSDNFLAKIYKIYHSRNNINIKLFSFYEINNILKKTGWKVKKRKKVIFSNIILAKPIL
tara:strand:+ start:811 stop:1413 length:603 start_codon:yes stop_codon:yes gene_type:complete